MVLRWKAAPLEESLLNHSCHRPPHGFSAANLRMNSQLGKGARGELDRGVRLTCPVGDQQCARRRRRTPEPSQIAALLYSAAPAVLRAESTTQSASSLSSAISDARNPSGVKIGRASCRERGKAARDSA